MKDFKLDKESFIELKDLWKFFKLIAITGAFIGGITIFIFLVIIFFLLSWHYIPLNINTLLLIFVLIILYNQQYHKRY